MKTFIIIPAFNEAAVLEKTLLRLLSAGYRIILVDDGSTDDTVTIAGKHPVLYLRHCLNIGQGGALRTGMTAAAELQADIVVHFDADGQHDAVEIPQMIEPLLDQQCDIVFGSRFLNKTTGHSVPFFRKIILQTARYINWLFYGILLSDAHNGLRAMNRKALEKIVFTQNGMGHASEILSLVKENNLRYREVPVTIHYDKYSRKKGQSVFNSVNIFFDLIFQKLYK